MKKIYTIIFLLSMLSCAVMAGNRCNPQLSASSPEINVPTLPIIPGSRDSIILPFFEDWATGSFVTNNWSFDPGQGHWFIDNFTGNPMPSVQFGGYPALTNYNYSLVSPLLDATTINDSLTLKFDIRYDNFSISTLECMAVEVFDGATWQMVHDYSNANGWFDWTSAIYSITPYAANHLFKIRFRAHGENSYHIIDWHIDNIKIYHQATGNMAGTVIRLAGGTPMHGTVVKLTNYINGTYTATTDTIGNYTISNILSGNYNMVVEKTGYNVIYDSITITEGQTLTRDFQLTAPIMDIDPLSITEIIPYGQTVTRTITISNNGDGALDWDGDVWTIFKNHIFVPASDGNFPRGTAPSSIGRAPKIVQSSPASPATVKNMLGGSTGYAFEIYPDMNFFSFDTDDPATQNIISPVTIHPYGGTFDATHTDFMYIIDNNDSHLKKFDIATGNVTDIGLANDVGDGHTFTGLTCDKSTDIMYAVSSNTYESYLYSIDPATAETTVIGSTDIKICIDIAIDGTGQMYGVDVFSNKSYLINKVTGESTQLGYIGYDANYAQGMCWDPESDIVYLAAYNDATHSGELRILDRETGNTEYIGSFDGQVDGLAFPGGSSSWLSISPGSGYLSPGNSQDLTININGNYNPLQKGTKEAIITFTSNPDVDTIIVPVTLIQYDDYGTLTGIVTHNGIPVAGVTLHATHNGANYVTTSGNNGVYTFENLVPSTYSVTAEATGYNLFSTTGIIIGYGQTTTLPINLTAPTMDIDPNSLSATLYYMGTTSLPLNIINNGDGTLNWNATVIYDETPSWISMNSNGMLAPGTTQFITVPVAANLPDGTYHARIIFTSNPDVGNDTIPVTLTVLMGLTPTLTIETVTNIQPGPVSVPVHAENINNMGAFQFTIEYDPAVMTYTGTSNWYTGIDAVTVGEPIPGHLTFVWAADFNGIYIPDGNFFNIDFTWLPTSNNQTSALIWSDDPTPDEFSDYDGNIFSPDYLNGHASGAGVLFSTVRIEDANVGYDYPILVPVYAQLSVENLSSFQFSIKYDIANIFFMEATNWNPGIIDPVIVDEPLLGRLTFQWTAQTQGFTIPNGHFFDLVFGWNIPIRDIWVTTPITWGDVPTHRSFCQEPDNPILVNYINGSASGWMVGVPETAKESVKIYPNPASDHLNIEVDNTISNIRVINNLGITVYEQNITDDKTITLNTSGYRAGNYIVQLITKDGQTINRKMIKQ